MHTTTAPSGKTHTITISPRGTVHTTSGVLLGDIDGMTRLGWTFTGQEV